MDIRNCKRCGRLYDFEGQPLCPACNREMESKFIAVKQFILDHPSYTITTVSEEHDVPVQQLKRWIREERIAFSVESGVVIQCEKCGVTITTGRFCKGCKELMTNRLTGLYAGEAEALGDNTGARNSKMKQFRSW